MHTIGSVRSKLFPSVIAMAAVALVGCGVHGGGGQSEGPTTTRAASARVLDGKGVLAALRPAVAFVETPAGSGSAVLIDDGYLVTNAHVVEPFASVTVTFDGGKPTEDVPVVGLDLTADVAVLGPVKMRASAATFGDPSGLEKGDDLYLVGYPGDQETDRDLTIARGLLSRRRTAGDWKLQYLQSDAKIAGGQSGGALADDHGRVVGISGLSDSDNFALSISSVDVQRSIARIRKGKADSSITVPKRGTETSATFTLDYPSDSRVLVIPAAKGDRTLQVQMDDSEQPIIEVDDGTESPIALNQAASDAIRSAGDDGTDSEDLPEPTAATSPGVWQFGVPGGEVAYLRIGSARTVAGPLQVTTSIPFTVMSGDRTPKPVRLGQTVQGAVDYFADEAIYDLDLAAGQKVDIEVTAASGDMAYVLVPPGQTFDDVDAVDDTGGGLLDLDAKGSSTAGAAGTYELHVYAADGFATTYRAMVTKG